MNNSIKVKRKTYNQLMKIKLDLSIKRGGSVTIDEIISQALSYSRNQLNEQTRNSK